MYWSSHGRNLRSCEGYLIILLMSSNVFQIYSIFLTVVGNTVSQSNVSSLADGTAWAKALRSGMEAIER